MNVEALALGKDLALILLVVEAVILAIPLLVILFYVIKYLPQVRAPIRPNLLKVRRTMKQVEEVTKLVLGMVVQPLLWMAASAAGLKRALGYLATRR